MKFKNITKGDLSFKIKGNWVVVQPGKVIELSRNGLNVKGLEVVDKSKVFGYNFNNMSEEELKTYAEENIGMNRVAVMTKDELIESLCAYCHEESGTKTIVVGQKDIDYTKMTKDQLNDYAANIGFTELNTSKTKAQMIDLIVEYENEEN